MKDKKIGGLILFSKGMLDNNMKIGSITVLERIILTYQQVGLDPIVVVSDIDLYYMVSNLKKYPIIYLQKEKKKGTIDLLKAGVKYLSTKCHALLYTPAVTPMFTANTLTKLIEEKGNLVTPSYKFKSGHPLLIREALYQPILKSSLSLKDTIRSFSEERVFVNIEDSGVLSTVDKKGEIDDILKDHTNQLLSEYVEVRLEREKKFFDERAKLLLVLLKEMKTMGKTCQHMALSKRKAWDIINEMERELGFKVVDRRHGGRDGGSTELTEKGEEFLYRYLELENEIKKYAHKRFQELFGDYIEERE